MAVLAGCARLGDEDAPGRDQGEELAAEALKSMGGTRALRGIRFLAFDFVIEQNEKEIVRRSHLWDRKTGRYRLEGTLADGRPYVALFNIDTRQGRVFEGFDRQPAANPAQALEVAWQHYQADTAWLLGGLRLHEPGVTLSYAGDQPYAGRTARVVRVDATPEATSLFPGQPLWLYSDPVSKRPVAWAFGTAQQPTPATYLWTRWQPVGRLNLPMRFERLGSPWAIAFDRLFTPKEVADTVFETVDDPTTRKVKPLEPGEQPPPLTLPAPRQ